MSGKLPDGFLNLDPMMFDAVFATTPCMFGWNTEIPNINPHIVKYALGLYHFTQVPVQSHLVSQHAEHGRIMVCQDNLEEDKSCSE
jgi:hypothetical protein